MKFILIIIFTLALSNIYGQSKRSLANPEDRKYFQKQLMKIMKGDVPVDSGITPEPERNMTTDTFSLNFNVASPEQLEVGRHFEEFGPRLAHIFWCRLLKEFPQFNFFSLVLNDQYGKKASLTFHYLKNGDLEYYSNLQQEVIGIVFEEEK